MVLVGIRVGVELMVGEALGVKVRVAVGVTEAVRVGVSVRVAVAVTVGGRVAVLVEGSVAVGGARVGVAVAGKSTPRRLSSHRPARARTKMPSPTQIVQCPRQAEVRSVLRLRGTDPGGLSASIPASSSTGGCARASASRRTCSSISRRASTRAAMRAASSAWLRACSCVSRHWRAWASRRLRSAGSWLL